MCGRFAQSGPADLLARIYDADLDPIAAGMVPCWNVAPTSDVLALFENGDARRCLTSMGWGFSPAWAAAAGFKHRPINARCETAEEKRMFSGSLSKRRCAIPVDGWFEWAQTESGKQPYFFHHAEGGMLTLAGIWTPAASGAATFALLTQASTGELSKIHDRMPLLIPRDALAAWLEQGRNQASGMLEALRAARDGPIAGIRLHEVSREVNNARNDGAHLIARA